MVRIEIKGIKKSKQQLKKYNKQTLDNLNNSIHKVGFFIESEIKESISGKRAEPKSVDTGLFLRSIHTDNSKKFISIIKDNVKYGKFLEHGTTKIKPRKHFQNSLKRNRNKINKFIKKYII